MAAKVTWRTTGHSLDPRDAIDVLRFEVADLNQVIKAAAAASPLYEPIQEQGGLTPEHEVLPLSCFAVTAVWTPARLAQRTRYRSYRQVEARVLLDAGYPLWPTNIFSSNGPDPRNGVHYDLIVIAGTSLRLYELSGTKPERAAARERLTPSFQTLLALLGEPQVLPEVAP